jgi:hypothetical protein
VLRLLVISDAEKAAAHKLAEFAALPENHYKPGKTPFIPGDNPNYVLNLWTYRCVFTFTVDTKNRLFRHLSISVPSKDYPHPAAVEEISHLFGFKGSFKSWMVDVNKVEHCIVVAQRI